MLNEKSSVFAVIYFDVLVKRNVIAYLLLAEYIYGTGTRSCALSLAHTLCVCVVCSSASDEHTWSSSLVETLYCVMLWMPFLLRRFGSSSSSLKTEERAIPQEASNSFSTNTQSIIHQHTHIYLCEGKLKCRAGGLLCVAALPHKQTHSRQAHAWLLFKTKVC